MSKVPVELESVEPTVELLDDDLDFICAAAGTEVDPDGKPGAG